MLSGLMVLHLYYWGTNQFIVQRTLGARSDWDARMGTITAGFFKLLIPFLCIVPGMAAGYILAIDPATESDTAFAGLTRELLPAGYGLVGVVMAGLVAGILSTIDSMMNSTATLFTFDIYKKYIRPDASRNAAGLGRPRGHDADGRIGDLAVAVLRSEPRGASSTRMADYNAYLVPGVIVAYVAGILQPLVTRTAASALHPGRPVAVDPLRADGLLRIRPRAAGLSPRGPGHAGLLWRVADREPGDPAANATTSASNTPGRASRASGTAEDWRSAVLGGRATSCGPSLLVACTLAMCWFFR